VRVAHSIKEVF